MSETLMRQWHMLRLVPRQPSKRNTSDIMTRLADEGSMLHNERLNAEFETMTAKMSGNYQSLSAKESA